MVKFPEIPPLFFTVPGAACLYYALPPLMGRGLPWAVPLLAAAALLTALTAFFRVLGSLPAACIGADARRLSGKFALCLGFLGAGIFLGTGARIAASAGTRLGLEEGRIIGIAGKLSEDPRLAADGRGMGKIELEYARGKGGLRVSARGGVAVFFPDEALAGLRSFGRGSGIYVEGDMAGGRGGPLFRARAVHITTEAPALEQFRTDLRLNMAEKFSRHRWGGLSLALLLGMRDNLDTQLAQSYKDAGCAHVLALSGMHLAIVSAVLAFFLKKPLGLRAAALSGALFIVAYVFLVGVQPSLARSAIMYMLGALSLLGAFPRKAPFLLAAAFLLQLLIWPSSGDSLSFILSYLALAGILFTGEAVHSLFRGLLPEIVSQPLSASLGAFIATSPVTAAFFGIIQVSGIIAGLVIVPLTTLFMLASMAEPLLSLVPFLGRAADWALSLLYLVLENLVGTAARIPPLRVSAAPPVLALAVLLALAVYLLNSRLAARRNRIGPFS
ncbi:MAG: ComEC/Rec2 family competence protein [Spirochaetaceae bacterium]|jgi:competence protein ComEC|nr:ComEC/Rec2 family competence protein [Spirochaetaceae bacterium]